MVPRRLTGVLPYLWGLFLWLVILPFQATGIYGGDSGDLVTAAYLGGVAHPPGYPLYTLLGHVLSRMPIATVAWRVGLLSSLPHAAAATLVMVLVWKLTGKLVAGVFSSLVLVANYLFFLYSVTPEVFALLDLFLISLTVLVWLWRQSGKSDYLYLASFIFGLSLSHHHIILFFVPALFYWVMTQITSRGSPMKVSKKIMLRSSAFIILGTLPYLYIPIASRGGAIINWDRAVDVKNFIRLVTRQDYGTFVSSGFYGTGLAERIIQLKAYLKFIILDFTWVGVTMAVAGMIWLWRRDRVFALGLLIGIVFIGPIFFFYASFPFVNRFTIGTYERFLLPSYLFFSILIGLGMAGIIGFTKRISRLRLVQHPVFAAALTAVLFLYPLTTGGVTLWRSWGLRSDRTAENLGRDILTSVPVGSILLLQRDTSLFTTEYVRYALGVRPDVKLIHVSRLSSEDYPTVIRRVFPELSIPSTSADAFVPEFLAVNSLKFPIASISRLPTPRGWFWLPHGLVYLLVPEKQLPSVDTMLSTNEALWSGYHDPAAGILGRYNHLMLADTRDVYANSRIELGKTLVKAGKLTQAKREFEQAIALGVDTQLSDGYTYLGLTELFLKHCDSALAAFGRARQTLVTPEPNITLYEAMAYRDCVGNQAAAQELLSEFERLKKDQETPLK